MSRAAEKAWAARDTTRCLLQKVDVASRTVTSQSIVRLGMARVVAFRNDSIGKSAVVGYVIGKNSYYSASDPYPGYQVSIVPY